MITDIDNEFSEIDNLLKDVESLTLLHGDTDKNEEGKVDDDEDDAMQQQIQK